MDSKGIQFATKLPKYEYEYTITISERDTGRNAVTISTPVNTWIDEDGVVNETLYHAHIKKMLDKYLASEKKQK